MSLVVAEKAHKRIDIGQVWKDERVQHALVLGVSGVLWALFLYGMGRWRYENFMPDLRDLLFTEDTLWNTLNGRWFGQSFMNVTYFGHHFSPMLLAWLPFYAIVPDARTIVLVHAATISLSAWPVYLMARTVFKTGWQSVVVALIALITPFNLLSVFDGPYPDALALVFGGFLLYSLSLRRWRWVAVWTGALLLVREDYGLTVAGAGLYAWLGLRRPVAGLALGLVGLGWVAVMLGLVIPAFANGPYVHDDLNPALGSGALGVVTGALRNPLLALRLVLEPPRPEYLMWLLLPFAFLPLASPRRLLAALPTVGRNLVAAAPNRSSISTHYSTGAFPSIVFAFVGALAALPSRRARQALLAAAIATVLIDVYSFVQVTNSALPLRPPPWAATYREALSLIPPDVAIAATPHLAVYLARREKFWWIPFDLRGFPPPNNARLFAWEPAEIEWVVFDLSDVSPGWQGGPAGVEQVVRRAFPAPSFELIHRTGNVMVLRRARSA